VEAWVPAGGEDVGSEFESSGVVLIRLSERSVMVRSRKEFQSSETLTC